MAIDTITNVLGTRVAPDKARESAPLPPRPEAEEQTAQANRPTPPRRPANLISTVTQSLEQAGLATQDPNAISGVTEANPTETGNDPETAQSEKVAQALQAFMHSLLQAVTTDRSDHGGTPATESVVRPGPSGESRAPTPAADAYGGLVSRLESLVREIEASQNAPVATEELTQLDSAFKELARAATGQTSSATGSAPNLQAVLKNIARNLQSTGDPTLASTGNVINTAA